MTLHAGTEGVTDAVGGECYWCWLRLFKGGVEGYKGVQVVQVLQVARYGVSDRNNRGFKVPHYDTGDG